MSPYNILSDIKSGRIQVKSMDSATILFFKCQRWDNTILAKKMEELFISKIKESPSQEPSNHNMTSQTIHCFTHTLYFAQYTAHSAGYFISSFHFSISLTFISRSSATFASGILSFKSEHAIFFLVCSIPCSIPCSTPAS